MTCFENIPDELRTPPLWLQYYLSADPKKPDKKPRKHPEVRYATPADRTANLRSLDYLIANRKLEKNGGYQRYIDLNEGFLYVDLDHCRDPQNGEVQEWAQRLIDELDTYCEISASGTGFHLVCRAKLPRDFKLDPNPVEIYSGHVPNKLMALTGNVVGFNVVIQNRQEQAERLLQRAEAGEFGKAVVPAHSETSPQQITSETFDAIQERALLWFWKNRIPKNKVTILGGNPDAGKSLVSIDLTARSTRGSEFPDSQPNETGPIEVALLFCEDDAEDTVKPRLLAAGADCAKVHRLHGTYVANDGSRKERHIAFDTDLPIIERFLQEHRAIRLLVVDPISNYLGAASMVKESEVRHVLVPLAEMAARLEVTVVLIAHLNKRSDVSALHKIMGAVAISGVARAAWMFAEDPENEGTYLMVRGKLNVGKKTEGLCYSIEAKDIPGCGEAPFIKWNGTTDVSAGQVLGLFGPEPARGEKTDDAATWLKGYLAAGNKRTAEIRAVAERAGIAWRTLERVKGKLGVISDKRSDGWYWRLPAENAGGEDRHMEDQDSQFI